MRFSPRLYEAQKGRMPKNADVLANYRYRFADILKATFYSIHILVHGKVFLGKVLADFERGHFSLYA